MKCREREVRAAGVRFHVVESGSEDAPLVLLLHGFPEDHGSWRFQMPVLGERFRAAAPDLKGYGRSDGPRSGYDLATLAAEIAALVRALGCERARIVGHDWGGVVAWALAALHPDVVESLTVLNAPHPHGFLRGILWPDQLLKSWYMFFFQIPKIPERWLSANGGRRVVAGMRAVAGRRDYLPREEADRYRSLYSTPESLAGPLAYYRANAWPAPRLVASLARPIRARTLVVWGEKDGALGLRLTRGLERYAPSLQRVFVPEAGHWVHQERPEEVNRALLEFLK